MRDGNPQMALRVPYREVDVQVTQLDVIRKYYLLYTKYTSYRVLMSMVRRSRVQRSAEVLNCHNYGSGMNGAMVQMKLGDEIET